MATSTVENYLKAILLRSGDGDAVVPMGLLAEALDVTPGTTTTMVKAMAAKGLLDHMPREGVRLTETGREVALGVLRKHRLVETFLVRTLKMDWAAVHQEAEALEHAISDGVLERIDALLGHPEIDPHGDPIPDAKGRLARAADPATLATCPSDKALRVRRIADQTPAFLEFVQQSGLKPGARVRVSKRDRASGVVHCDLSRGQATTLGFPEAAKIEVGS
jgi:DtxR family Mn-dependent transcriptional regulator